MPNALVLGASGTIGSVIARELLKRGYDCGLHCCSHRSHCEALAAAAPSVKTQFYHADFNDAAMVAAFSAQFLKDFGTVDVIVWAAGITKDAPLLTQDENDLRAVLNVNLKGCFLLLKAFSRQFIKQKSGSVVVLSSHAARAGRAGGAAYAMAEAGLIALVQSAAREWGPMNVRVNAVLPPFVPESGMGKAASPEFAEAAKAKRVLKAESSGAEATAQAVLDVLSNSALSGQVVAADSRITV